MVKTEIAHPGQLPDMRGFSFQKYSRTLEQARSRRSFNLFIPFIQTTDLPPQQATIFKAYLRRLFKQTGRHWEPGNCRSVTEVFPIAKQIAVNSRLNWSLVLKTYKNGHFWMIVTGFNDDLIIDPWGRSLPYFGLQSFVPNLPEYNNASSTYRLGTIVSDLSTIAKY